MSTNQLHYINSLLEIYESNANGKISKSERDELIFEMKTRADYALRHFKKKFKFVPNPKDKTKGYITFAGHVIPITIVDKEHIKVGGVKEYELKTNLGTGEIDIDWELLKRLSKNEYRDGLILHEIGHSFFHALSGYDDMTRNEKIINEIIDDMVPADVDDDIVRRIRMAYYAKMCASKLPRARILEQLREECLEIYIKYYFSHKGNGTPSEYEADRFAANKIGSKNMIKAVHEAYKIQLDDATKLYEKEKETLTDSMRFEISNNKENKSEISKSYEPLFKELYDTYKKRCEDIKIDKQQRIGALKDMDIIYSRGRHVYN